MTDRFQIQINEFKIIDFTYWTVSVNPRQLTIGAVIIKLKREHAGLHELEAHEAEELPLVFNKTTLLITEVFKCNNFTYHYTDNLYFEIFPVYSSPLLFQGATYRDIITEDLLLGEIEYKEDLVKKVFEELISRRHKKLIGYSTGVFDLFHVGHLNILEKAKKNCDYHLVGVTTDEEVLRVKGFKPVIPYEERARIVRALSCVDEVVPESNVDKIKSWERNNFDIIFKGDDWKGSEKWNKLEDEFAKLNVKVQYFPYTKGTSSTHLKNVLSKIMEKKSNEK
jgi:glycerol-3-phosphate cytidylyltransferase